MPAKKKLTGLDRFLAFQEANSAYMPGEVINALDEHGYQVIPADAEQTLKVAARQRLHDLGYDRVEPAAVDGTVFAMPGAEVWRCDPDTARAHRRAELDRALGDKNWRKLQSLRMQRGSMLPSSN